MSVSLRGVLVPGALGAFDLEVRSPLSFLVEPAGGVGARTVFRLLAGLIRPRVGEVRIVGADGRPRDPAHDAEVRRGVALLGDPALLADLPDGEARPLLPSIAGLRGVPVPPSEATRLAWTDHLAAPAQASLVLLAFPEEYADAALRDAALAAVTAAVARGATAIVATHRLDTLLSLARTDPTAPAHLLGGGRIVLSAPAHQLPWSAPARGGVTRTVQLVAEDARSLAARLLGDAVVAPQIASLEPVSARELHLHVRDPRLVVRAIAAAAHAGQPIESIAVLGASPEELLGGVA